MSRQVFLGSARNTEVQQWRRARETLYEFEEATYQPTFEYLQYAVSEHDFTFLRAHYRFISVHQASKLLPVLGRNIDYFVAAHLLLLLCYAKQVASDQLQAIAYFWPVGAHKEVVRCFLLAIQALLDSLEYSMRLEALKGIQALDKLFYDYLLPEYFAFETLALRMDRQHIVQNITLYRISEHFTDADPDEQHVAVQFLRTQLVRCAYDPQIALDSIVYRFTVGNQLNLYLAEEQMDYIMQLLRSCQLQFNGHVANALDAFCLRILCSSLRRRAQRVIAHLSECHVALSQCYYCCVQATDSVADDISAMEHFSCCLAFTGHFPQYCAELREKIDRMDISAYIMQNPEVVALLRALCLQLAEHGCPLENDALRRLLCE